MSYCRVLGGRCFLCARYPCRPRPGVCHIMPGHLCNQATYRATSLKKNATPQDPTVGMCLGSHEGPRGVGVFLSARFPCTFYADLTDVRAIGLALEPLNRYRGTSSIRNSPPPRATIGP